MDSKLTSREMITVKLLGDGEPHKAIASLLGVSTKTVSTHYVTSVKRKLGVTSLAQIVKWAIAHGLTGLTCLLFLCSCSTPKYSPVPPPSKPIKIPEGVMLMRPVMVGPTDRLVVWKYPAVANSNWYSWSLEKTTNFLTWITVTNYPSDYSGDVWVTNDWRPGIQAYRMHGRL